MLDSGTYEVSASQAEGGVTLELTPASIPMATVHLNQVPHQDRLAMFGTNTCVVLDNPGGTIQVPEDTYYIPAFGSYTANVAAGSNTILPPPADLDAATGAQAYNPLPDRGERIFAAEPPGGLAWSQPQAEPFAFSRQSWRTMELQVVAGETKRPVGGAKVQVACYIGGWSSGKQGRRDLTTDTTGRCTVRIPGGQLQYVNIEVSAAGFVPTDMSWDVERSRPLPQRYTWPLQTGITIGGSVRDERDRPVRNALVLVSNDRAGSTSDTPEPAMWSLRVRTDRQGTWRMEAVPPGEPLHFWLVHPDYISDDRPVRTAPIEQLRDQSAVFVMKQGINLEGKVLGPHDNPVKDATISRDRSDVATTDRDGRFRLRNLKPGEITLVARGPGCAPDLKKVDVQPNPHPVEFKLQAARVLKGRVVDESGQPIPQAQVGVRQWRGGYYLDWNAKTDMQGRFRWDEAPVDAFWLSVDAEGRESEWVQNVVAGPDERVIVLKKKVKITGRVVDAASGQPVPTFKAFLGRERGDGITWWDRYDAAAGKDGAFALETERPYRPFQVRVEAEGYLPGISSPLEQIPSSPLEFALVYGEDITGVVLGLDDQPLSEVQVAVTSLSEPIRLENGRINRDFGPLVTTTDAQGLFHLPPQIDDYTLLAAHDRGFASVRQRAFEKAHRIRLEPWGRIEGLARCGSRTLGTQQFWIRTMGRLTDREFPAGCYFRTVSDEAGHFTIERMAPGIHTIEWAQNENTRKYIRCRRTIEVKPGQTTRLDFEEPGRPVKGRFHVTPTPGCKVQWDGTDASIQRTRTGPKVPESLPSGSQALQAWYDGWRHSEQGLKYRLAGRSYVFGVDDDGAFETSNLPPGRYVLFANFSEKDDQKIEATSAGTVLQEFEVTGSDGDSPSPLDLGTIAVKPSHPIKAGQAAPAITCKTVEGQTFSLSQCRGKYVLLGFWAAWDEDLYGMGRLKHLQRLYAGDDRLSVVSLSLDPQPEDAKSFATLNGMPGVLAHLGIAGGAATLGEYGITWVPVEVLVDPEGRIIGGSSLNTDIRAELVKALGKPDASQPATTRPAAIQPATTQPAATAASAGR